MRLAVGVDEARCAALDQKTGSAEPPDAGTSVEGAGEEPDGERQGAEDARRANRHKVEQAVVDPRTGSARWRGRAAP
jgi:hypothetical protein